MVFDTRPFEVLFVPPHPRAEPSHSILHYPQRAGVDTPGPCDTSSRRTEDPSSKARSVRFGVSEIRVFEMLEPQEMDLEDPAVTERSKDKKSKAAAQDELKELLARKQEEYKKLQMEKQKNKRQGGKGKKGAGGAAEKGADKGQAGTARGMGNSPSQELLIQITAANAALGKDPLGVYMYDYPLTLTLTLTLTYPNHRLSQSPGAVPTSVRVLLHVLPEHGQIRASRHAREQCQGAFESHGCRASGEDPRNGRSTGIRQQQQQQQQ